MLQTFIKCLISQECSILLQWVDNLQVSMMKMLKFIGISILLQYLVFLILRSSWWRNWRSVLTYQWADSDTFWVFKLWSCLVLFPIQLFSFQHLSSIKWSSLYSRKSFRVIQGVIHDVEEVSKERLNDFLCCVIVEDNKPKKNQFSILKWNNSKSSKVCYCITSCYFYTLPNAWTVLRLKVGKPTEWFIFTF